MDRLLESKADTAFGTLSNAEICNVFSVKQDLTAGRCMNAGNEDVYKRQGYVGSIPITRLAVDRTASNFVCASGSVGGARPCQGRGRGFESRLALFLFMVNPLQMWFLQGVFFILYPISPSS